MRHTVLVALASAAVAWLAVASFDGSGRALAERAATLPEASAGLIALPTSLADGRQMLTIVDPRARTIGVYQIDQAKGEIALKGVAEGTELTFTHSQLYNEETRSTHEAGWSGSLDKLQARFGA